MSWKINDLKKRRSRMHCLAMVGIWITAQIRLPEWLLKSSRLVNLVDRQAIAAQTEKSLGRSRYILEKPDVIRRRMDRGRQQWLSTYRN